MQSPEENHVFRARKVSLAQSFGSNIGSSVFVPVVHPMSLAFPEVTRLITEVRPFSSLQGQERQHGSLLVHHHSRHQGQDEYPHQHQTDRRQQQQPQQSPPLDPVEPCRVTESASLAISTLRSSCFRLISSSSISPTLPPSATSIPHVRVAITEDNVDSKNSMELPHESNVTDSVVEEVIRAHSPYMLAVSVGSQPEPGQWQRHQITSRYATVPFAGLVPDEEGGSDDGRSVPSTVLQQAQQDRRHPIAMPSNDLTRYPPADGGVNNPTVTPASPVATSEALTTPGEPLSLPALPRLPSQPYVIVDTTTNEIVTRPYSCRRPRTLTLVRSARPTISQSCSPFTNSTELGNTGPRVEYFAAGQSPIHPMSVPLTVKSPSTLPTRQSEELVQLATAVRTYGLDTIVLAAAQSSVGPSTNPTRPLPSSGEAEEGARSIPKSELQARKSERHPLHPSRLFNAFRRRKRATKKSLPTPELPTSAQTDIGDEVDLSSAPAFDEASPPTKSSSFAAKCRRGWKAIQRLPKKLFGSQDKEGRKGATDSSARFGAGATAASLGPIEANTVETGECVLGHDDRRPSPADGTAVTTTDTATLTSGRHQWWFSPPTKRTQALMQPPPPCPPTDPTQFEVEVQEQVSSGTLSVRWSPLEVQSSHSSRAGLTAGDPWTNITSSCVNNILPLTHADLTFSPSSSSATAVEEILLSQDSNGGDDSAEENGPEILHPNNIYDGANGDDHSDRLETRRGDDDDDDVTMRMEEGDHTTSPDMSESMANSALAVLQRRPPSSRERRTLTSVGRPSSRERRALTSVKRPSSWSWPHEHSKRLTTSPVQGRISWPSFEELGQV